MSDLLSLFPLPGTVLFPNIFLPLHIFEPRYREIVADAIAGDRVIGMVLLKPGWERDYEGTPPIFDIGCSGVITHFERLPDGRYNIMLRGIERFRVVNEDRSRRYRRAVVETLAEGVQSDDDRAKLKRLRTKLESLLATSRDRTSADAAAASVMNDADLVNALAQYFELEPLEKQALLERDCLLDRAESLVDLLEMKVMVARTPGGPGIAH